ncbi:MAG: STAS domain-containing protein [Thermodesulfobacteriota bacterium]|nr:STAS domain-containing protein [Thermodesulfobacteriota bacterium]
MSVIIREEDKITIRPNDNIVASMSHEFREELLSLIEEGEKGLSVDMRDVFMIDSVGIGILVAAHNSLSKYGRKLTVINLSEDIYRLFQTMRLDQHIEIQSA